jgi:hypothetical protein
MLRIFYYLLIGAALEILVLGCAANTADSKPKISGNSITSVQTPTLRATAIIPVTPRATNFVTPTNIFATPTVLPTNTPIPHLVWGNEVEPLKVFDLLAGKWSPVDNKLILHSCFRGQDNKRIVRIDAPEFTEIKMSSDNFNCYGYFDMAWTPDGQQIIYTGPPPEDYPDPARFETMDVWLMGHNGEGAHLINPGKIMGGLYSSSFGLIGWADNHTVIYKDHSGTFEIAAMLDITTGEYYSWLETTGGALGPSHPKYLSANALGGEFTWVMKRLENSVTSQSLREMTINDLGGIFLKATNKLTYTQVLDWRPGTEQSLIFENNPDNLETRLSLWDVNQNILTILAPHGVDGHFSPNGHFLVYITRDPIQLKEKNKSAISPQQTDFVHQLHLFDMAKELLTFSTLVTVANESHQPKYPLYNSLTTFSPDSRYLTFFTSNELMFDGQDSALAKDITDDNFYLHIFDTTNGEMVSSTPSRLEAPIWSPNSDRFIFRDQFDNLTIFSVMNSKIPLTQSGGIRMENPQWSFDGSYLSVRFYAKGNMPWEREFQTAIFQVP